ncbi:MAG: MarC family protein [Verrucomicrobiales bacterium]
MIALALLLFLIMDPFGNLVAVNTLLADQPPRARRWIILREAAIATAILLLAAVGGSYLLDLLGLKEHSLRLAGGIVLFLIALGMLFPARKMLDEAPGGAPLIVPIAMPLIAGPSAISMVILFSKKHPPGIVIGGVVAASLASAALLVSSPLLFRFLGKRGSVALERLMGMLLIMISVQMILDGFSAYLDSRG